MKATIKNVYKHCKYCGVMPWPAGVIWYEVGNAGRLADIFPHIDFNHDTLGRAQPVSTTDNYHFVLVGVRKSGTRNDMIATLAHECKHAINFIFDRYGQQLDANNDEIEAYTLAYLMREGLQALEGVIFGN